MNIRKPTQRPASTVINSVGRCPILMIMPFRGKYGTTLGKMTDNHLQNEI